MGAEFDLIDRFFSGATEPRADVEAGIGDDAALVVPPPGAELVSACTVLHEGADFAPDTPARTVGRRAVEDGLRALADSGNGGAAGPDRPPPRPAWALLGLTLPAPDPEWLAEFAAGLADACREAGIELVGGDTTRGPRTVVCLVHAVRPPAAPAPARGGA